MTYEEFKAEYTKLFGYSMKYSPDQVGSSHFMDKMAALADAYPEYEERIEDEACAVEAVK
jgi:hypothetical protein